MSSTPRQKTSSKRPVSAQKIEPGSGGTAVGSAAAAAAPARAPALSQTEAFDRAFAAFHARRYAEALPLFEAASAGAHLGMAHTAAVYTRICSQKAAAAQPVLSTAEDLYNFAVALMNARKFAEAQTYLLRAVELAPQSDHIHYALAITRGHAADGAGARASLQRAIELNPRNLYAARNDPDFSDIAHLPHFADLLYPGNTGA